MRRLKLRVLAGTLALACGGAASARAEVSEVRISKQYGLPYLSVVVMEQNRLIEKHAKVLGLGDIKVTWATIGSGGTSTDALLAGNLDFVTSGVSNMLLLWSRTGGQVKALAAAAAVPLIMVTRNPNVKTIADLSDKDKIAVPTVKVSMQSTILGIAAEKLVGEAGRGKFDPLTVAMAHPDATAYLLSGGGELTTHFSAPPYQYQELKAPGVHEILNSTEVMGGPATIAVVFTTTKFYDANPKTIAAMNAALGEAVDFIAKDRRGACELYLKASKEKLSVDELVDMIAKPGFAFTLIPNGVMKYAEQMYKTGIIKSRPENWKDAFFPSAHSRPGS
ncbi:MAG: ABC transporter substrate-binding protein [Hyphomicrobiaceae bacterium]|nr:ABC transporter substrate-binding protein [Hyphomicrobiaceae bacterium]